MKEDKSTILEEITKIRDEKKLLEIYKDSDDFEIKYTIVNLIDDDTLLYEIFSNEKNPFIKGIALNSFSTDILNFDDMNQLDEYEKITYIETHTDKSLFFKIAENDKSLTVRLAAIIKIEDRNFLLKMADSHEDYDTRVAIYKKLNNKSLTEEITGENLKESRINLIECLDNEEYLKDITINDSDMEIRLFALKKLNRPNFYFRLLKDSLNENDLSQYIKDLALNRFSADDVDFNKLDKYEKIAYIETHTDKSLFFKIAEKENNSTVRIAAIDKIYDKDFLKKMAKNHSDYNTRVAIYKKLINRSLAEEITGKNLEESRKKLVKKLDNEKYLEDIVNNDSNMEVQLSALKKLNKSTLYIALLKNTSNNEDLIRLIGEIKDESQLIDVAFLFSSNQFIVENAVNNIADLSVLFELYHKGPAPVREAVMKKLVFGNIFSKDKIAESIRTDRMILSLGNEDIIVDMAKNASDWNTAVEAVELIDDKNILTDLARNGSYVSVRKAAVEKIGDEDVLEDIARNDPEKNVRSAATEKITNEEMLAEIAKNESDTWIVRRIIKNISNEDILKDFAKNHSDIYVRLNAVEMISDEDILEDIAKNIQDPEVRKKAAEKLDNKHGTPSGQISPDTDEDTLVDIAINDSDETVRRAALERIENQNVLADIVRKGTSNNTEIIALEMISDEDILFDIAENNPNFWIRLEAVKCIANEDFLVEISKKSSDYEVRRVAAEKIGNEDVLVDIFRNDCNMEVREAALKNIKSRNTLHKLILENFGYFPVASYTSFKRNYDYLIYESIGVDFYENILDAFTDESVLIDMLNEKLFSDFRVLIVRRLTSQDALINLALNDPDHHVRLAAVKNPNLCDNETLIQILKRDYNGDIRFEALKKIDDDDLVKSATDDLNPVMQLYALEKLGHEFSLNKNEVRFEDIDLSTINTIEDEDVLCSLVKNAPSTSIKKYAFDKIKDENTLAKLLFCNTQFANRALKKITDNRLLLNIALYSSNQSLKRKAIKKIDDEKLLIKAVENNPYNELSSYIVDRIRDERYLEIIASNNSNPFTRKLAVNKIENQDTLTRLGENESEEAVCTAIARKTHNKSLLEYIGLSNPCKTVRRYVGNLSDDDEFLYKLAKKECESDNRRELVSKLKNEELIYNLLKRESADRVFGPDLKITDPDLLIDLAKDSFSYEARRYALKNIKDKSIILDFIYTSPFTSKTPKEDSIWKDIDYNINDMYLCLSIISEPDFDDMELIEDILIKNDIQMCGEMLRLRDRITEIPSIYRIVCNCKSKDVRSVFKKKLEYSTEYEDDEDDNSEENVRLGLGALFN